MRPCRALSVLLTTLAVGAVAGCGDDGAFATVPDPCSVEIRSGTADLVGPSSGARQSDAPGQITRSCVIGTPNTAVEVTFLRSSSGTDGAEYMVETYNDSADAERSELDVGEVGYSYVFDASHVEISFQVSNMKTDLRYFVGEDRPGQSADDSLDRLTEFARFVASDLERQAG